MTVYGATSCNAVTKYMVLQSSQSSGLPNNKNNVHTVVFKEFDIYFARFGKVFSPLNKPQTCQVSQDMTHSLVKL